MCALLLLTLSLLVYQLGARSEPPTRNDGLAFTILHTNDLHAHDETFDERGRRVGGLARIAYLIQAIRKSTPNVVTVDGGDIFQGTSFFRLYHGETEVAMLNKAGYDIYTIGNHEFDEGPENLAKQLKNANFDIVSANIDAAAVPELAALIKPSVVRVIDGQKVAFVGAVTPELVAMSLRTGGVRLKGVEPGNLDSWMAPIKSEVDRLAGLGINKIVLVTHVGVERDRQLAEAIPSVDVIVGGHSHTRLDKPVIVQHADGTRTIIVQAGCYGRALGRLQLRFDEKGELVFPGTRSSLISINASIPELPEIKAYLAEKGKPINALRSQVVGVAVADFDNRFTQYPWDSAIGSLVCDALSEAGTAYGATITFHNRGGVRARIDRGLVTMEKIEEVLPFDNYLLFATVKGSTILKTLEYSLSGMRGARFLDVHGLKVAYDPSKQPGHRLVFVLSRDKDGTWKDIDPEAEYKIALNDFTFNGGEGYDFSGATNVQKTKDRLSKVLATYLIKHKKVAPEPPSRIVPVSAGMLTLKEADKIQELAVSCPVRDGKMMLVVGDGRGVAPSAGVPVPLSNPRIIASAVRGRSADLLERSWRLPLKYSAQSAQWASGERWAAVVVHRPKPVPLSKTVITEPVRLPSR